MKNLRRLLSSLLLLGSLAGALPARADDDASHKAAAEELLTVMQSQRTVDRLADQMGMVADRLAPPGHSLAANPADDAALRESLRQQARDVFKEQLKWETLEPLFAQLYIDTFTEPEIKQLIEFYKSPVGQKLVDKQPELASKFARITQQKAMATIPAVTQKLRASIQKYRDEHPEKTPTPSASPAASPSPVSSPSPSPVALPSPALTVPAAASPAP